MEPFSAEFRIEVIASWVAIVIMVCFQCSCNHATSRYSESLTNKKSYYEGGEQEHET